MCAAGAPVFIRTYSSVMNFPGTYAGPLDALRAAGWRPYDYGDGDFISSEGEAIAWYERHAWHVACRHRNAWFNPRMDTGIAHGVFGQPSTSFVIPTTIVVPLVNMSTPTGDNAHCLRIYPDLCASAFHRRIFGSLIEFRVCTSELDGQLHTYAEANFGGARFTATGDPRRAVYIGDHKLLPSVPAEALMAEVLLHLPKFVHEGGFCFDPLGTRTDIPRVGSYGVLPRHGSFYAELRWPAPSATVLLAFDATGRGRVAQAPVTSAAIIDHEDAIACAMSSRTQTRSPSKQVPIMASIADAVRAMMQAKKLLPRQSRRTW